QSRRLLESVSKSRFCNKGTASAAPKASQTSVRALAPEGRFSFDSEDLRNQFQRGEREVRITIKLSS
ncbi:MAG: hypothetical protein ABR957_12530, partial [Terracidiphilus sp.]